tara:strand:- start:947 stop:1819 length:873 start_codon:yes stop_codon:yes gene_type:complete
MSVSEYNNILGNIQSLQTIQQKLHMELSSLQPNSGLDRQKLLIREIDEINDQKVNLFKNLYSVASVLNSNIEKSTNDQNDKQAIVELLEEKLSEERERMKIVSDENINNLRMNEINTYYSGYYSKYVQIFKYVIYTCVGLLLVTLLRQRRVLNSRISNILAGIVLFVGGFFILRNLYDLGKRNNLEINQYDFVLDKDTVHSNLEADGDISGSWKGSMEQYEKDLEMIEEGDCIGPECCVGEGLKFDKEKMVCKLKNKKEGFTNLPLNPASISSYSQKLVQPNPGGGTYYF